MSEFMESTGRTVDEAIREALLRMGLRREEVEVTVIQRDRGGLLGIGRRQAVVRVERKSGAKRGASSSSDSDRGDSRRRGGGGEERGERLDDGRDRGSRRGRSAGGRGRQDGEQAKEPRGRDQGGRGRGRDEDRDRDGQGRGTRGGRGRGRGRRDGEPSPAPVQDEVQAQSTPQPRGDDRSRRPESDAGDDASVRRRRRSRRRRKPGAEVESAVTNPAGDGRMFDDDAPREQESRRQVEAPRDKVPGEEEPRRREPRRQDPVRDERPAVEPVDETAPAAQTMTPPAPRTPAAAVTGGRAIAAGQVAMTRVAPFTAEDAQPVDGFLERVTTGLMVKSGFPCRVQVKDGEYQQVKIVVDDRSAGVLIGRQGAAVDAVEYLVEKIASRAAGDRVRLNLDINNYRLRRHDSIEERARNAAAEARRTGEPVAMAPMHGRERRLVHLEIEEMDDLVTYTEDGYDGKYVVICRPDQVPAGSTPSTGTDDQADGSAVIAEAAYPRTMVAAEADAVVTETAAVITDDADDLDDDEPLRDDD